MNRLSYQWRIVIFLWLAFALNYIDRQAAFSIFPILRKELGFSSSQLGLTGTMFTWVYALCMPLAGYIADAMRRDRLVVASLALWSAATLGTALSHSPASFLAWRAAMGVSEALYFPAAIGIIAVLHPGPTRSRALGFHQAAQLVGVVAGGWFGGWAAEHIGWRQGFGFLWLVGTVYTFVLLGVFRSLPAHDRTAPEERRFPRHLPSSPLYWVLLVAFTCYCAMLWITYAWLPDVLYERFRFSLTASGLNATLFIQASCVAGVVLGGWLADRLVRRVRASRLYLTGCGMCLSAPFAYLMFATDSVGKFRLYAAAFGFVSGLHFANVFAAAYDLIADRNYSFAGSILNMAGGLSAGVTVWLAGYYKATLGVNGLMAITAAMTVFAAGALLFAVWRSFEAPQELAESVPIV